MRKYKNKSVSELSLELCSGVARLRQKYLDSAEELVHLINPNQSYPYDFVVFKLTDYRPSGAEKNNSLIEGKTLRHDLLLMMLDLSESFELSTRDYDQAVFDTNEIARKFNVSTKTVQRWRQRGLPARRLYFPDGKRRVGFLESSLEWFLNDHSKEVQRSMKFSQLTSMERAKIIRRAKRMARFTKCTLGDVARRIAKKTGRAVETIRYTIKKYDNEKPYDAIFPHLMTSLGDQEKRRIYRSYLRGISVPTLAEQYHRTRGSIYRIVNEMRALQLIQRNISYVENEEFVPSDAYTKLIDIPEPPAPPVKKSKLKPPAGLPPYLRSLYEVPLFSAEQEVDLFRRYNFLKYLADQKRKKIDLNHVSMQLVKEVEGLLMKSNVIKNKIIRANLRLVVSIAKKHISGPLNLFELISDGNVSLMRAVEKFDYAKGFRFSTYASWAIMRNFARSVPKERYQLDRFSTGHDEVLDIAASLRSYDPSEDNPNEMRESINAMLAHLTERERIILIDHYGLDQHNPSKTFDQLGKTLGISKERVRQIEIQALSKLREITKEQ